MKQYIYKIKVDGMHCGMCESHINDQIRKNFDDVKVSSSHIKKQTIITSKKPLDQEKIADIIKNTGYYFQGIEVVEEDKKPFLSGLFKR